MALEVKSMEVAPDEEQAILNIMYSFGWRLKEGQRVSNRTTVPRGAFTYQGVTLIHSETEVDEYSTLVFERDTRLIGYERITELEAEFWDVSEYVTERRPPEPPPMLSFEEWLKLNKPRTVSLGKRILVTLLFFPLLNVIGGLVILALLGITVGSEAWVQLWKNTGVFAYSLIASIPLSILASGIYAAIHAKASLKKPSSKGYQKALDAYKDYECNYNRQLNAPKWYDYACERIPTILAEVKELLDQN